MLNLRKIVGIIAVIAIIGFVFFSCGGDDKEDPGNNIEDPGNDIEDPGNDIEDLENDKDVLTISGTFGGATVNGQQCPVRIIVKFEYDDLSVKMSGSGAWSVKHLPFEEEQPLWFEVDIYVDGTNKPNDLNNKLIRYQYDIAKKIENSSITGIELTAINIENTITLSGTANTTLNGNWRNNDYWEQVLVVNEEINNDLNAPGKGWKEASACVKNGNWSIIIPSSSGTNVSFGVALEYFEDDPAKYPYGLWESGKRNKLNPMDVKNNNIQNIALGTVPFVVLSGNTPVTVNGKRPLLYWLEFGLYWDEDPEVIVNGWSGATQLLYEGSSWSVPMPADILLAASVLYYEKARNQFRGGKGLFIVEDEDGYTEENYILYTGNKAQTLNFGSPAF